jgi:hypothetical protein
MNNNAEGRVFDWAYIDFTLPKIGTFTVGKQPVTLGYGLAFSAVAPGLDGVKWQNTWGPVTAAAMWFKTFDAVSLGGGSKYYNRDASVWALDLKVAPNDKHLIELFGGMLIANSTLMGAGGTWHGAAVIPFPADADGMEMNATVGFVGLAYTGNIADMIDIKFENSWVFGGLNYNTGYLPAGMVDHSLSVEGWNVYADVSYYNDLLRVGVAFLMGSGAKHYWNDASLHNINMVNLREDDFAWANIIGNGYGGLDSVYIAPGFGDNAENLTSVKLYFNISPMEKLTLNAAVVWAKWTDPVGSGFRVVAASPAYPHPANWYSHYAFDSWAASSDLGWEVDLGLSYEIMEGLTYTFAGGVLFAGDSWDYVNAIDGTREDWGAIWSVMNMLRYTF